LEERKDNARRVRSGQVFIEAAYRADQTFTVADPQYLPALRLLGDMLVLAEATRNALLVQEPDLAISLSPWSIYVPKYPEMVARAANDLRAGTLTIAEARESVSGICENIIKTTDFALGSETSAFPAKVGKEWHDRLNGFHFKP